MANYIETASVCQQKLDEAAVAESCTAWMEANAGDVIYDGGNEIKIPSLTMQGLADYDTTDGYQEGDISFKYQTVTMTQDRGRGFTFDSQTTNETNYALNIGSAMGQFQREHVVPEIDAYRISTIASKIITADITGMTKYSETLTANKSTLAVLRAIKTGLKEVRKTYSGPVTIQIDSSALMELEIEMAGQIQYVDMIGANGIITKVPSIDKCPLIETPSERMVSAITLGWTN